MADHRSAAYLVSYDIAEPRRLVRLHRLLKQHGLPVQYSVFCVNATPAQLAHLLAAMGQRIDPGADDVRVYRIPEQPQVVQFGLSMLPEGILPGAPLLSGGEA